MNYNTKDFSIVIATFNRQKQIKEALARILKQRLKPLEVIVVDQSTNNLTKQIVKTFSKKIRIKYVFSKTPSIAIAKSIGIKYLDRKGKIVLFLDDDAEISRNYLANLMKMYNILQDAVGIASFVPEAVVYNKLINFSKKLFFLGYLEINKCRMISPYGNTYPVTLKKPIGAEWFSGTNPSFKKEIFKKVGFDRHFIGWSLGEDIDISYNISKIGKLYLVPNLGIHHYHPIEEQETTRIIKRSYMNQINHFYLYYKDFPNKFVFLLNLAGLLILRSFALFNLKDRKRKLRFKFFLKSLCYCVKNRKKIKKGDLSLPL